MSAEPPTAVPGVQKQLTGAPSGPYDCVVRGGVDWPVTWATGKGIAPTEPMAIRERMGITQPNVGATIDQAKQGYESYQGKARKLGLELGNLNVRDDGASSTTRDASGIAPALEDGSAIVLFVWYGKVNSILPELSGDPWFSGGHCWTLYGIRQQSDGEGRDVLVYDPLHDGKAGRPDGPLWAPLGKVLDCAAAFRKGGVPGNDPIGEGKAIFGIAKRARVIEDTEPGPVPPEPTEPDDGTAALEEQLEAATDALEAIAELAAPWATVPVQDGALDAEGPNDAATEAPSSSAD